MPLLSERPVSERSAQTHRRKKEQCVEQQDGTQKSERARRINKEWVDRCKPHSQRSQAFAKNARGERSHRIREQNSKADVDQENCKISRWILSEERHTGVLHSDLPRRH